MARMALQSAAKVPHPFMQRVNARDEEKRLTEAITNGSGTTEDYIELAEILSGSGRFDPAVRILREALRLPFTDPGRADIAISLGWILINGGRDWDEAIRKRQTNLLITHNLTAGWKGQLVERERV